MLTGDVARHPGRGQRVDDVGRVQQVVDVAFRRRVVADDEALAKEGRHGRVHVVDVLVLGLRVPRLGQRVPAELALEHRDAVDGVGDQGSGEREAGRARSDERQRREGRWLGDDRPLRRQPAEGVGDEMDGSAEIARHCAEVCGQGVEVERPRRRGLVDAAQVHRGRGPAVVRQLGQEEQEVLLGPREAVDGEHGASALVRLGTEQRELCAVRAGQGAGGEITEEVEHQIRLPGGLGQHGQKGTRVRGLDILVTHPAGHVADVVRDDPPVGRASATIDMPSA